jgi:hypothetical protein
MKVDFWCSCSADSTNSANSTNSTRAIFGSLVIENLEEVRPRDVLLVLTLDPHFSTSPVSRPHPHLSHSDDRSQPLISPTFPRSLYPIDHLDPLLPLDLFPHAYTHTLIVLPILTAILVFTHIHIHNHIQNTKNIHVSICCCCTLNLDLDPSRVLPTRACDRLCVCYLRLLSPCLSVCLCALIVLYTTTS